LVAAGESTLWHRLKTCAGICRQLGLRNAAGRRTAHFESLAAVGVFKPSRPATPKKYSVILVKLQFPDGADLRDRPTAGAAFFNRLTFLHILARNFIIYWYTGFRHPDHGAKPGDPGRHQPRRPRTAACGRDCGRVRRRRWYLELLWILIRTKRRTRSP
jgi:hypothetical protein